MITLQLTEAQINRIKEVLEYQYDGCEDTEEHQVNMDLVEEIARQEYNHYEKRIKK